jgi:hypothetical protein
MINSIGLKNIELVTDVVFTGNKLNFQITI